MFPLLGLLRLLLPPCIAVPLYLLLLLLLLALAVAAFSVAVMFTCCCGFLLSNQSTSPTSPLQACERGRRWAAALALFAELAAADADDIVRLDGYLVGTAM